ncbi:MAG: hypothetical protein WBA38_04280 [Gordonia sp. (in: high G+C Gram-positive bacteria)]|uniref:hypothetical protein n=1 Tax=Gordonia sp. (in: high G+C Gram-positive bacteria) TaxID=84139 RepID=UPI003C75EA36
MSADLNLDSVQVVAINRYFYCDMTFRKKAEVVISDGNITIIDPSVDLADMVVTP